MDCVSSKPTLNIKLWKDEQDPDHEIPVEKLHSILDKFFKTAPEKIDISYD